MLSTCWPMSPENTSGPSSSAPGFTPDNASLRMRIARPRTHEKRRSRTKRSPFGVIVQSLMSNSSERFTVKVPADGLSRKPRVLPAESRPRSEIAISVPASGWPRAGTLIAISERGLDPAGNILGFLLNPSAGTFTVKRSDEFDISDCTITPKGDLLILERRFSWVRGLAIRIRKLALSGVKPGALLDGPEVFAGDMGQQVDNMEGISIHRAADGATVLTLISDDNFSPLQRTVLLQFALND